MAEAVTAAIAETGAAGIKDMGKVMAALQGEACRHARHGEGGADGEGEAVVIGTISKSRKASLSPQLPPASGRRRLLRTSRTVQNLRFRPSTTSTRGLLR